MEDLHGQKYGNEYHPTDRSKSANKRTSDDVSHPQPRSKRSRYISIAWSVSDALLFTTGTVLILCLVAMNASAVKSSVTGRHHASAAVTSN